MRCSMMSEVLEQQQADYAGAWHVTWQTAAHCAPQPEIMAGSVKRSGSPPCQSAAAPPGQAHMASSWLQAPRHAPQSCQPPAIKEPMPLQPPDHLIHTADAPSFSAAVAPSGHVSHDRRTHSPHLHLDEELGLDAPRRLALALATCGAQRINLQAQPRFDVGMTLR